MESIVGQRFGRLVVLAEKGVVNRRLRVLVKCDCGKRFVVLAQGVKSGNTKSCGCLKRDKLHQRQTTHGMSKSPEFFVWAAMIARCTNPTCAVYKYYGGRGIRVCKRWRTSFANFIADMGRRPSKKHELDRFPDNDGDYKPSNCRWATRKQQTRNTRRNRFVIVNGKRVCVQDASAMLGVNPNTVRVRIYRGMSPQEAVGS